MDSALLIVRLVVGLYVAAHGAQKFLGWFDGPGFSGAQTAFADRLGLRPAWLWTWAGAISEVLGGLLMAVGLLGSLGPIGVASAMLVAVGAAHWPQGPWAAKGGYELALTNLAVAVAVAIAGVGAYSLDTWLGIQVPTQVTEVAAAFALLAVIIALATRRRPSSQTQASVTTA